MRTKLLYVMLLIIGLVAVGAVPAFATSHEEEEEEEEEEQEETEGGSNQSAREQRLAYLREARNASIRSFQENRSAAIAEYREAFNATKASFLENKTRVLAECAEARNETEEDDGDENETDEGGDQCVRTGLKPLIDAARAEHKEQKDALLAALLEARQNAKAAFQAARAAYGPHGSG